MTINEAIRILNLNIESGCSTPPADLDKAEQLGIEALKRIKEYRAYKEFAHTTDLSSETGE